MNIHTLLPVGPFVEVDHGPFVVDNNLFLSPHALLVNSQGGAYAHNLMVGAIRVIHTERRETPYHPAHSTTVAGLQKNPSGDDRYYNNLMAQQASLTAYDATLLPVFMRDNVFFGGAKPSKHEPNPHVVPDFDPSIALTEQTDGWHLVIALDNALAAALPCQLITTAVLGKAKLSDQPYENADGSPLKIDSDYFGKPRNVTQPTPGPFENLGEGDLKLKIW